MSGVSALEVEGLRVEFGRLPDAVQAVQRDFLGRGLDDMSVTIVTYEDVPVVVEANYFVPGTHRDCVIVGGGRQPRRRLRKLRCHAVYG